MLKLTRRRTATLALLAALPFAACAKEEKKAGLVIAVQTDMSVPKDVDEVAIEVSVYGNLVFSNHYEVGQDTLNIPATLTLLPPEDASSPVTIKVLSFQNGTVRTLRRVVTTVPDSREALLRMPIQWLCDGEVEEESTDQYKSTCKSGNSCLAGSCTDDEVDSKKLPSFTKAGVFGAKNADGEIACFDTVPCLATNVIVPASALDLTDCTVSLSALEELGASAGNGSGGPLGAGGERATDSGSGTGTGTGGVTDSPDGGLNSIKPGRGTLAEGDADTLEAPPPQLNFGLSSPAGGPGICSEDEEEEAAFGCFVPLDYDAVSGWTVLNDVVQLPQAVCKRLENQDPEKPLTLVVSDSCEAKAADTPPCGPWLQNYESYGKISVDLPDVPVGGTGGGNQGSGGGIVGSGGGGPLGTGGGSTGGTLLSFPVQMMSGGAVDNASPLLVGTFLTTTDGGGTTINGLSDTLCTGGIFDGMPDAYAGFMLGLESIDDTIMGFRFAPNANAPSTFRMSVNSGGITYCAEAPLGGQVEFLFAQLRQKDDTLGTCSGSFFTNASSTISSIDFVALNVENTATAYNLCLYELVGLYPPAP